MDEDSDTESHGRSCGHVDIQRFSSADDPDFKIMRRFLRKTIEGGKEMIEKRRQSESREFSVIAKYRAIEEEGGLNKEYEGLKSGATVGAS
jgi:hypothetical protein